jgi:hypothetical protein
VTEKWKDKWFRQLKPSHKLLWLYLLDNCDISGIIESDIDLWKRDVGFRINETEFLQVFSGRLLPIPNTDYIWIPKFIEIQQRCKIEDLNPENNAHKGILKSIEKYGLLSLKEGATEGLLSPICNGNSTSNGNSKGKEKEESKKIYGEFENVFLTDKEREKLTERLGRDERARNAIEILSAYKKSKNKKYDSDYATFHTWVISELEKRENNGTGKKIKPDPPMIRKINRCIDCKKEIPELDGIVCKKCNDRRRRDDERLISEAEKQTPQEIQKEITESLLPREKILEDAANNDERVTEEKL